MATFTKTVSNSVNLFGPEPSTLWNAFLWGVGKWGWGTNDLKVSFYKVITNSQTLDSAVTPVMIFARTISNSISSTFEMSEEYLKDAAGYCHVFIGNVTDADEQIISTYTQGTGQSTSYTAGTGITTVWS